MTKIRIMCQDQHIASATHISYGVNRKASPIYTLSEQGKRWYEEEWLRQEPVYYGSIVTEEPININSIHSIIIEQEQHGEIKQTTIDNVEFFHEEEERKFFVANSIEFRSKIVWYDRALKEIGSIRTISAEQ